MKRFCNSSLVSLAVLLSCFAFACGGGGSTGAGGSNNPPPSPLQITSTQLPAGVQGQAYSSRLQATGGKSPYTWTSSLFAIPGMSLGSDGTVSGTPTQPSNFYSEFTVTDSNGVSASSGVTLMVVAPLSFQVGPSVPDANVAIPTGYYVSVSGGVPPYNFSTIVGNLPPGTSINNYGLLQGTPTTPGNYNFTVQVTDSFSPQFKISQAFTWNIRNGLVIPNSTLPDAVQNLAYSEYIQPAGGTPPYHLVLSTNSALPAGMHLNTTTGQVYGTPTSTTQYGDTMLVFVTDSASPPASINPFVTLNVQPALSFDNSTFPDSARGLNYSAGVRVTGGRAPYKMQLSAGNLPDGVTLANLPAFNNVGLSGVPTADGLFKFTLRVSDSYEAPNTLTKDYQIRISDQMTMGGPTYVELLYNQSYTTTFPITGGCPPYTWHMNDIPAGFTFDTTTGTLSGTPAAPQLFGSVITAHDSSNPPLIAPYTVFSIQEVTQLLTHTTNLPPVATGSQVNMQLSASGGGVPYNWTVSSGNLPPGIAFAKSPAPDGLLTGSPTTAGVYNFTVNLSDGGPGAFHQTVSQALTWAVKDPGQMTRNDTIAQATPLSNISLLASISPVSDPTSTGPDVDVYSLQATPGSRVIFDVSPNNDFLQPPEPNSLQPVLEILDATGKRYQTCAWQTGDANSVYNLPCVNGLPLNNSIGSPYFTFKVPGSGTTPLTYYIRVSDMRGDARPDFIYTLSVYSPN